VTAVADYLRIVRDRFPEIVVDSVATYSGQFNDVLILNDALVFRFPRTDAAAAALRSEILTLQHLRGRLPIPIPAPKFTGIEDIGR